MGAGGAGGVIGVTAGVGPGAGVAASERPVSRRGAPGTGVHQPHEAAESFDVLEQLEGRELTVIVVGKRVVNGALVAVISAQMEDEVVIIRNRPNDFVGGD